MRLLISGNAVQTFTVQSGADSGNFQTFTFNTSETIAADDVRIEFINDLFDPDNGFEIMQQ